MSLLARLKPPFWDHPQDHESQALSYRRMWLVNFWVALIITMVPLLLLALLLLHQIDEHYQLAREEQAERLHRVLSGARLRVQHYLRERQSALALVLQTDRRRELEAPGRIQHLLGALQDTFGGFVGLSLWDSRGRMLAHAGSGRPPGGDSRNQNWFRQVRQKGQAVGPLFRDNKGRTHLAIAVGQGRGKDQGFILRASLDGSRLQAIIRSLHPPAGGRAFLVDQPGRPQAPDSPYPDLLAGLKLPSPPRKPLDILTLERPGGESLLVGLARVSGSPFTLAIVTHPERRLRKWSRFQVNILIFVGFSVLLILVAVYKGTTKQVTRLYQADLKRAAILREIVYTNKLASIGRLAAGVAHEINNPSAIINEKAGLMKDLLTFSPGQPDREKLLELAGSILAAVKRVSTITHRLLGFARHLPLKIERLELEPLVREVLGFLGKEASYRNITVNLVSEPELPAIKSDRSLLEQVFLNIINNALNVLGDGGRIDIHLRRQGREAVSVSIRDNGRGIAEEDLKHIFEPFFTTRGEKGTGLGLSITYGIVHKLGGTITVESQLGRGTCFTVTLPLESPVGEEQSVEAEIGERAFSAKGAGD